MARTKRILTITPTVPLLPEKPLVNHFGIALDRSTSMYGLRYAAMNAFNNNVKAIKDAAKSFGQQTDVSLVTFGSDVRTEWQGVGVDRVSELTDQTYRPNGNTALFDAVATLIENFEKLPDARTRPSSSWL